MSGVQEQVLSSIFQLKETMDVTLIVPDDDREVRAHRVVLMGASEYFNKRFSGPWDTETPIEGVKTVIVTNVTFETLDLLVAFIYTNQLQFTETSTVPMAILAADFLMMTNVLKALSGYVSSHIETLNIWELYPLANKLTPEVAATLRDRVRSQLQDGPVPSEVGCLEYEEFYDLVCGNKEEMGYFVEDGVFQGGRRHYNFTDSDDESHEGADPLTLARVEAIKLWLKTNPEKRQKHILSLLASINFPSDTGAEFICEDVLPLCKDAHEIDFLIGLFPWMNGYSDFIRRFLNDLNVKE